MFWLNRIDHYISIFCHIAFIHKKFYAPPLIFILKLHLHHYWKSNDVFKSMNELGIFKPELYELGFRSKTKWLHVWVQLLNLVCYKLQCSLNKHWQFVKLELKFDCLLLKLFDFCFDLATTIIDNHTKILTLHSLSQPFLKSNFGPLRQTVMQERISWKCFPCYWNPFTKYTHACIIFSFCHEYMCKSTQYTDLLLRHQAEQKRKQNDNGEIISKIKTICLNFVQFIVH